MSVRSGRTKALVGVVAGLLAGLGAANSARADDWSQAGGEGERRGASGETLAPGLVPLWSAPGTSAETRAGVAFSDGVLLTVDVVGRARAFAADAGTLLWERALGAAAAGTPLAASGRAVIPLADGRVFCLALESGSTLWTAGAAGPSAEGPALALADGRVFLLRGFPERRLVAVDLVSGATRWERALPELSYAPPAVGDDLVVLGADDGVYRAFAPASGADLWSYPSGGRVLFSGASLDASAAYLLPGGEEAALHRVGRSAADWANNWTLPLPDPSPPGPAGALLSAKVSAATPAVGAGRAVCVVRVDSTLDEAEPWGIADRYVSRERVYVIDPAARSVVWSAELAGYDGSSLSGIPPYGRCPQAIVVDGASPFVVLASSAEARVQLRSLADGAVLAESVFPGQRWAALASPALANTRLALVTARGAVRCFALSGNVAPQAPVPDWNDGAQHDAQGQEVRWTPGADPDDALAATSTTLRLDRDGEVLIDWEYELVVSGTDRATLPALPSDVVFAARLRSRDAKGAYSPWSEQRSLAVALAPAPPTALRLERTAPTELELSWQPSPSSWVAGYRVLARPLDGGPSTGPVDVGPATRALLGDLREGTRYELSVRAYSTLGRESSPALLEATPQAPIHVNGQPFFSLWDAVAAAQSSGGEVQLGAGSYLLDRELVLVGGAVLRGAGPHRTRLVGAGSGVGLRALPGAGDEEVLVRDLGLRDLGTAALAASGARLRLRNVLVHDVEEGVAGEAGSSLVLERVTVAYATRGARLDGAVLDLDHSLLVRNELGVACAGGAEVRARFSSLMENRLGDLEGCVLEGDDLDLRARFLDPEARDLRVEPGSPTVDAGDPAASPDEEPSPNGERLNLGAFAGTPWAATSPPRLSGGGGCALSGGCPRGSALALLVLLGGLLLLRRRS